MRRVVVAAWALGCACDAPSEFESAGQAVQFAPYRRCGGDSAWRRTELPLTSPVVGALPSVGLALADFDGDGLEDLAVPQFCASGDCQADILWGDGARNPGPATSAANPIFSASVVDYDQDGRMDLALQGSYGVSVFGWQDGAWLRLVRWTHAQPGFLMFGLWSDFDADGLPDWFGAFHTRDPYPHQHLGDWPDIVEPTLAGQAWQPAPRRSELRLSTVGEDPVRFRFRGTAMHAIAADLDEDGDQDLVVLNDFGFYEPSIAWENEGGDWTSHPGCGPGDQIASMGGAMLDVGDGVDLWSSNDHAGLAAVHIDEGWTCTERAPVGPESMTWSVLPVDVDGDGARELFVSGGGLPEAAVGEITAERFPMDQPTFVMTPGGDWQEVERGATWAVVRTADPETGAPRFIGRPIDGGPVWQLDAPCTEAARLQVDLRDSVGGDPFATGARVEVDGERRWVGAHQGTASGRAPTVRFAFPDDGPAAVRVVWPDGELTVTELRSRHGRLLIER